MQVSEDIPRVGDHEVSQAVSITLYDFGGLSISYEIPLSGTLEYLRDISILIDSNEALPVDSLKRAKQITSKLGDAVDHPSVAAPVEDYLIFEISSYDLGGEADTLHQRAGATLAQILRAENKPLSESETADALAYRISYGPGDVTFIDWNAAIIFDSDADDVRSVLEFANTELLELRFLDYQLDSSLDKSFELSARPRSILRLLPGSTARNVRRISHMQLEGAILFERVSNAPKLLGDQFLARVYRLVSNRFHVGEWNSSILRKLDTIEDFYKQIHDTAANSGSNCSIGSSSFFLWWKSSFPSCPGCCPASIDRTAAVPRVRHIPVAVGRLQYYNLCAGKSGGKPLPCCSPKPKNSGN